MTTRKRSENPWLSCPRPNPGARLRLLCLPYAGGSAQIFRGWEAVLHPEIEVLAVRFPGRGKRFQEPPFLDLDALVDALVAGTDGAFDRPYAVLGHSMGALIGFELVHRLIASGVRGPEHMIASGRRAPHLPDRRPPIRDLPRDEFVEEIRRQNGTPIVALESPDLMDLVLPALRADCSVCETYRYFEKPPLDCPISVYGGLEDPHVRRPHLQAWERHTTRALVVRMFPGNHFFIQTCRDQVLERVVHDVWSYAAGTR